MPLTPLVPVARPVGGGPRWSAAASTLLHVMAILLVIGIAARVPPPGGAPAPSYDLVFEAPHSAPQRAAPPGLPPIQPADIPTPDDAPLGTPSPAPLSPPSPDGAATALAEAPTTQPATAAAPPPEPAASTPAPAAAATPAPTAPAAPRLAFAPPAEPAITAEPLPPETPATPSVNLQSPSERVEAPDLKLPDTRPIMPQPPPPLPPQPAPPRRPTRQALGTLSNPMDLNLGPAAPRPAARGTVASRAIDLSPPPERQGPSRSDPYAQIRAVNASEDWNRGLLRYWLNHRYYPQQAAEDGEQGTVTIQLTVNRSGRVEDVEVLSRSGSQWLDMAAVATFRDAHLPPFTNEMRQDRLTFPIPITYYLVRR